MALIGCRGVRRGWTALDASSAAGEAPCIGIATSAIVCVCVRLGWTIGRDRPSASLERRRAARGERRALRSCARCEREDEIAGDE